MHCLGIDTDVNNYKEKQGNDHHKIGAEGGKELIREGHRDVKGTSNILFLK